MNEVFIDYRDHEKRSQIRAELKRDGWLSAHYLVRHGWNADVLRAKAKKGEIEATVLNTSGTSTWYYRKTDLDALASR